jgi:hypothetical protein
VHNILTNPVYAAYAFGRTMSKVIVEDGPGTTRLTGRVSRPDAWELPRPRSRPPHAARPPHLEEMTTPLDAGKSLRNLIRGRRERLHASRS